MRAVAAAEDYDEAMSYERYLDQLKTPEHSKRQVLQPSISTIASMLAAEALKFVVMNQQPALLGNVVEYDVFELTLTRHALLEHPACPVCSQKKNYSRVNIPAWRS
jgi:bacteriocin biosynthesis cyclodehydratase domain-containing protein